MAAVGPKPEVAAAEGEIKQALQSGTAREAKELPPHLQNLPERNQAQEIQLRRFYATWLLVGLGIELLIANAVFVLYAAVGRHWKLEAAVVDVWLGQTVVQVVGIVHVVTRHLFPEGEAKTV
jgi:hypothetical protein